MKKWGIYILVSMFLLTSCQKGEKVKTLILGHSLPTAHPVHAAIMYFADLVSEKSGGKIKVKVYPNSQLGSEREVLELVQIGSVSMTKVSAGTMANFSPKYRVLGIPYIFESEDHAWKVLEGEIGREILDSGQDFYLNGLVFYDAGARSFYTKEKPIRTAADVQGLKLRVMNDPLAIEMVNMMGGSATPMSFGELYTALQQGVVDGAENNAPSVVSSNHYEVCKYYSLDRHTLLPDVLVIGMSVWKRLTEEEKNWIQESANESLVEQKKLWDEAVEKDMKFLQEQGMEIIQPDASSFREATKPLKNRLRKDPVLGELMERIENLVTS